MHGVGRNACALRVQRHVHEKIGGRSKAEGEPVIVVFLRPGMEMDQPFVGPMILVHHKRFCGQIKS